MRGRGRWARWKGDKRNKEENRFNIDKKIGVNDEEEREE